MERFTHKPAMVLGMDRYAVRGDDGRGYLLCAGAPDGEDSETIDSFCCWSDLIRSFASERAWAGGIDYEG